MIQSLQPLINRFQKQLGDFHFCAGNIVGFSLLISFAILAFFGVIFDFFFAGTQRIGVILSEVIAFGTPMACLLLLLPKRLPNQPTFNLRLNWGQSKFHGGFWFTIKFALTLSFLSFFVNLIIYAISDSNTFEMSGIFGNMITRSDNNFAVFLAVAIIPALAEELVVRGALFSCFEHEADTSVCILCSGLCFAMLHGSLVNFAGPLIAGCGYAYLTYSYRSVWPAVLAHAIHNLYYLIVNYLLNLYSSFGIWNYFTHISVILFLFSLYFTLRSYEYQIERKTLQPFVKSSDKSILQQFKNLLVKPGMLLFIAVFLIYVLIG